MPAETVTTLERAVEVLNEKGHRDISTWKTFIGQDDRIEVYSSDNQYWWFSDQETIGIANQLLRDAEPKGAESSPASPVTSPTPDELGRIAYEAAMNHVNSIKGNSWAPPFEYLKPHQATAWKAAAEAVAAKVRGEATAVGPATKRVMKGLSDALAVIHREHSKITPSHLFVTGSSHAGCTLDTDSVRAALAECGIPEGEVR